MKQHSNQPSTEKDQALLEFSVGPLRFCAPVLDVVAIISPPEMVHVPVNEDMLVSCFSHNNETVTVLSMHNKFGLPLTRSEKETHIILAYVGDGLKGFWVDQALDLVKLDSFGSNDDYSPDESKAYSNFLTRDEEVILQTSFQRLFHCAKSSLLWLQGTDTSEPVEPEEAITTESTDAAANSEGDNSDKELETETESTESPLASPETENRPAAYVPVEQPPASSRDEAGKTPLLPSTPPAARAAPFSSNSKPARSIPPVPEPAARPAPAHVHTYMNSRDGENEPKARRADKGNGAVILVMALLVLLAVALGSIFLLGTERSSVADYRAKLPDRRDSKTKQVHIATKPEAKKPLEQPVIESPVIAPSENQSLNQVAEEDATISQPAGRARVFELRVNEQQDTNSYRISSFEPVKQQQVEGPVLRQQAEPEASEQIFTHVVVKGDTLWHITRRYLDNPKRYPELAAASHIDNPHRIYPGDVIRIIVNR